MNISGKNVMKYTEIVRCRNVVFFLFSNRDITLTNLTRLCLDFNPFFGQYFWKIGHIFSSLRMSLKWVHWSHTGIFNELVTYPVDVSMKNISQDMILHAETYKNDLILAHAVQNHRKKERISPQEKIKITKQKAKRQAMYLQEKKNIKRKTIYIKQKISPELFYGGLRNSHFWLPSKVWHSHDHYNHYH